MLDNRTAIAISNYRKIKAALAKLEGLTEVEAALAMACHTGPWLTSLTPEEIAHIQRGLVYRTIETIEHPQAPKAPEAPQAPAPQAPEASALTDDQLMDPAFMATQAIPDVAIADEAVAAPKTTKTQAAAIAAYSTRVAKSPKAKDPTVAELKALCKARRLPVSGTKAELILRLRRAGVETV